MDKETINDEDSVFDEPEEGSLKENQEDKTEAEEAENKDEGEEEGKNKKKRSEIAQKKHWREKAQKSSSKVTQLETELAELKKAVKKPDDDKEAAAQDYIRNQARQVFEELQKEKAKDEAKQLAEFEEKVEAILDDNPDISEEELLEVVEEFEVTPAVALKILKKNSENKSKKPKMPKARGASPESKKELPDDSKKSMFEILKEEREKLKNNLK